MKNGNGRTAAHLAALPMFLRAPRAAGLWLVGVLITIATVWAFAASYHGLYDWFIHHQWPAVLAAGAPLLVDLMIVVPEVILFVAMIDGDTPWRVRLLAWLALLVFTSASVVANADHIAVADWPTRAGFGLPPLVLAIALGFGLGELKRQAAKYRQADEPEPETASAGASAPASLPSLRQLQAKHGCGQATARKIRAELAAFERGRGGGSSSPSTTGAAAAPATERGRDGAPPGRPPAVPAAQLPAGAAPPVPAGASLNGNAAHG